MPGQSSASDGTAATPAATLLLVDDEDNILSSLQRVLRKEPYRVLTASSGEQALQIMDGQKVDLIISDAQMPGMDGPSLLAQVKRHYPWCIRILLTGHTNTAATIKAVNEGQIYRYIAKPWADEELRLILRQALAYQYSERRRLALEKLTREQNRKLQQLNAKLEQKVEARTAELQQTADMLDLAFSELKQSYVIATEVFSSLINQRLPTNRQPNAKIIHLTRVFAEHLGLNEDQVHNLSMAAALYNLGKLSWPDELFLTPSDLLGKSQQLFYQAYPVTGERLLLALEPLRATALIIRHHQERWNGHGIPDRLAAEAIPEGSRILKLVIDFVEYQFGLILERKLSRDNAINLLQRYKGRLYDPGLTDQFLALLTEIAPDIPKEDVNVLELDLLRVEPGMSLARNLYAASGMLLLNRGKVLTETLIKKLAAFEKGEPDGHHYLLYVNRPETKQAEATG